MSMYVEQTEIAMPPSCTFIRERQERRAVAVAVEVKQVRSIQLLLVPVSSLPLLLQRNLVMVGGWPPTRHH